MGSRFFGGFYSVKIVAENVRIDSKLIWWTFIAIRKEKKKEIAKESADNSGVTQSKLFESD